MSNLTMQCAWCRRRYDERGVVGKPLPLLEPEASHGLCLDCLYALVKRQYERLAASGDWLRARRAHHVRVRLLLVLLRRVRHAADPPDEAGADPGPEPDLRWDMLLPGSGPEQEAA